MCFLFVFLLLKTTQFNSMFALNIIKSQRQIVPSNKKFVDTNYYLDAQIRVMWSLLIVKLAFNWHFVGTN